MYGVSRFDEMQRWLGISRNILTRRLADLIECGYMEKRAYQQNPQRYEYSLTEKGHDACNVLLAMMPFADRWYFKPGREPIELVDTKTGKQVVPVVVDANTGKPIDARQVVARPGPGFKAPKKIKMARFSQYYGEQP